MEGREGKGRRVPPLDLNPGDATGEDRMMICGIVLRQHRNVTDDRRHPHAI